MFDKKAHSSDLDDANRLIGENTPFAINEAFRSLYTKVIYLPIQDKCKKIAVTSALSGEGKTYTSINLALSLAQNSDNKRVLLVDLDMRKPRVSRILSKYYHGLKSHSGTSEYLAGIDEKPNFVSTDIPNFTVLFSGKESANAIGLMNSFRMKELIEICNSEFDYVIFDTPPVTVVSDAVVIADKINGYIITARADYSNINHFANAVNSIRNVNGEILGAILTDVNPKIMLNNTKKRYQGYYNNYYSAKGE